MDRETVEEIKRHFGAVIEDVKGDVRAVGVVIEDVKSDVRALAEGLVSLRGEMHDGFAAVRSETAREFEETRGLIRLSYGELDRRVRDLESEVADLRGRLDRVEARLAS